MRALVLKSPLDFQVMDIRQAELGDFELRIRTESVGFCSSDFAGAEDGGGGESRTLRRLWSNPLTANPSILGCVEGHECSGVVVEVGKLVTNFSVGDRVVIDSTIFCNNCDYCKTGRTNLCQTREVLGVSCDARTDGRGGYNRLGAFAETVTAPNWCCHKIPDGVSFDEASMFEAISVAIHGLNLTKGDNILIIGAGTIGKAAARVARSRGKKVSVLSRGKARLQPLLDEGFTGFATEDLITFGKPYVLNLIRKITNGAPDAVIEMSGSESAYWLAVESVKDGGHVTFVGDEDGEPIFPLRRVVKKELTCQGSCAFPSDVIPQSLEAMQNGTIDASAMISHHCTLEEVPCFIERMAKGERIPKLLVHPNG